MCFHNFVSSFFFCSFEIWITLSFYEKFTCYLQHYVNFGTFKNYYQMLKINWGKKYGNVIIGPVKESLWVLLQQTVFVGNFLWVQFGVRNLEGFLFKMNRSFLLTLSWIYACKTLSCLGKSLLFEAMKHLGECVCGYWGCSCHVR